MPKNRKRQLARRGIQVVEEGEEVPISVFSWVSLIQASISAECYFVMIVMRHSSNLRTRVKHVSKQICRSHLVMVSLRISIVFADCFDLSVQFLLNMVYVLIVRGVEVFLA